MKCWHIALDQPLKLKNQDSARWQKLITVTKSVKSTAKIFTNYIMYNAQNCNCLAALFMYSKHITMEKKSHVKNEQ